MEKSAPNFQQEYQMLVQQISETYQHGQERAHRSVNRELLDTKWKIGQYIVEFKQGGSTKAQYPNII